MQYKNYIIFKTQVQNSDNNNLIFLRKLVSLNQYIIALKNIKMIQINNISKTDLYISNIDYQCMTGMTRLLYSLKQTKLQN